MTSRLFSIAIALCLPALGGCSSGHDREHRVHVFRGEASLPLTGELGPAGLAFQRGFEAGLATSGDSTISWSWSWRDNGGSSSLLQDWIDSLSDSARKTPDLMLCGFGPAMADLDLASLRAPVLFFGDGTPASHPDIWPLWPDRARLREVLSAWVAVQDTPGVALVLADGAWTPPFLDTTYPGFEILPHDPLIRRWDREMGRILQRKPNTVICWNRPVDAESFVTRPLIAPFLADRTILLPEGVPSPLGAKVFRFRPLWQPAAPVDSFQIAFLHQWGAVVGRAVATSTLAKVHNSLGAWRDAFQRARCDSARIDPAGGGWIPRMEIEPSERDSQSTL